ncbi:UNVERIFIED_CONTAM: hypothetical protein BEN50_14805 [Euhalothece sp. KZN 001]
MPLIKVHTSVTKPDANQVESLLKTLSSKLSKHLGKPESFVMTAFQPEIAMTFSGTTDPVCYIEIKNVGGMSSDKTQAMSQEFCQEVEGNLGVPANRTYIEFAEAKGAMWGWNGSTLG